MDLAAAALTVLLLNIPFGYWRENVRKFSVQWALAIHVPVPFVVLIRLWSDIGFAFITYPILIAAFFGGQYIGKLIHRKMSLKYEPTSCLVMDLVKTRRK